MAAKKKAKVSKKVSTKKTGKKATKRVIHIKSAEVLKWDANDKAVVTKAQLLKILNEFRDLLIDDIVKGLETAK